MTDSEDLTEGFLLRIVLAWYADPGNWAPNGPSSPYAHLGRSGVAADFGRKARAVLTSKSVGDLLRVSCDVLDVPVTEVARRSRMSMARIAEIVSGSPAERDESVALRSSIESLIKSRGGAS